MESLTQDHLQLKKPLKEEKTIFSDRTNRIILVLVYISIFFNSIVLLRSPAEIYIGYLVFIVLLPVFLSKYKVPGYISFIFTVLLVTGILNVFLDNNSWPLFLKIFIGLFLSYLFYYFVIKAFDFKLEKLFHYYLLGCFIAAIIGLVQFASFQVGFKPGYNYSWILNKWGVVTGGNFGIRINSIFGEPTYLATTMAPAFFVAAFNLLSRKTFFYSKLQSAIVAAVYLLSFSGLAYMGIIITALLLLVNFGLVRYILIFIPVFIVGFSFMYNNVEDFRHRYDSTIEVFSTGTFTIGRTHGSSIILYNNYHVATENFKSNFLFGTGLGSHPVAFEKYSITKDIGVYGFDLNSADANSMFLRLVSETGLFGTFLFVFITFRCYVKRPEEQPDFPSYLWIISNAILVMLLLNLLRQGHYFLNGFPFFVWLYYFNYLEYKRYYSSRNQSPGISASPPAPGPVS